MQSVLIGGASWLVREGTSDHNTVQATAGEDEYGLEGVDVEGRLVFDIGAHIGGVAVTLARRGARVVAVEPIAANADMILLNALGNGVHVEVVVGAIGTDVIEYGWVGDKFAEAHGWIANTGLREEGYKAQHREQVPRYTLTELVGSYGAPAIIKLDCEGGEWSMFEEPAIHDVPLIVGEWHAGAENRSKRDVTLAIGASHRLEFSDLNGRSGGFRGTLR